MASPRDRLRTHHHHLLQTPYLNKLLQLACKFWSLHVIGVSSKAWIAPAQVRQRAFAGMTKAAKPGHVGVMEIFAMERPGKRIALELRIVA